MRPAELHFSPGLSSAWASWDGLCWPGYEIHQGRTTVLEGCEDQVQVALWAGQQESGRAGEGSDQAQPLGWGAARCWCVCPRRVRVSHSVACPVRPWHAHLGSKCWMAWLITLTGTLKPVFFLNGQSRHEFLERHQGDPLERPRWRPDCSTCWITRPSPGIVGAPRIVGQAAGPDSEYRAPGAAVASNGGAGRRPRLGGAWRVGLSQRRHLADG